MLTPYSAYARALDATEYSYQTVADANWVAGAFELLRRRENVSCGKDITIMMINFLIVFIALVALVVALIYAAV